MGKVTLLDGAFGTCIWNKVSDKEPVWTYNMTNPSVVYEVTKAYVDAGSEIVQANTFGANRIAVDHSSDYSVEEVISAAMKIAKDAVAGTDVKIALSAGPLTEMMEPFGDLEEEEVAEIYHQMFAAGLEGENKADMIVLETFLDAEMLRVATEEAKTFGVPVLCTMTFEKIGKTMFGNSVEDVIEILTEAGADAIGLNCSSGPVDTVPIIKEFAEKTDLPLVFKPNAGAPVLGEDGKTTSPYTAEMFVDEVKEVLPLVTYLGGCCGSAPDYIAALKKIL